ncbi:MAG: hypothetical protein RBT49_16910 [Bacteroidales bacterium]|jgi:hypothetical protein|nr:hypothetical protein [Bacteroidales bacterium]
MSNKIFIILLIFLLFFSCKQSIQQNSSNNCKIDIYEWNSITVKKLNENFKIKGFPCIQNIEMFGIYDREINKLLSLRMNIVNLFYSNEFMQNADIIEIIEIFDTYNATMTEARYGDRPYYSGYIKIQNNVYYYASYNSVLKKFTLIKLKPTDSRLEDGPIPFMVERVSNESNSIGIISMTTIITKKKNEYDYNIKNIALTLCDKPICEYLK